MFESPSSRSKRAFIDASHPEMISPEDAACRLAPLPVASRCRRTFATLLARPSSASVSAAWPH